MRKIFSFFSLFFFYTLAWAQCGSNEEKITVEINSTTPVNNIYWTIHSSDSKIGSSELFMTEANYSKDVCLSYKQDDDYTFHLFSKSGSTWSGTYSIKDANNNTLTSGNNITSLTGAAFALGPHPCQAIDISVQYADEENGPQQTLNNGDTISTCLLVDLTTAISFPENNTHYVQDLPSSTYNWTILNPAGAMDGQTYNVLNPSIELLDHVLYQIQLSFTDSNDCNELFTFYVKNPTANTFVAVTADDDFLCEGQTSMVHVTHYNTDAPFGVAEPTPVFLDDVPGGQAAAEYESVVNVSGFPQGTTLDANCLTRVCVNMEHSWYGDLTIYLELPSGEIIDFAPDENGGNVGNGIQTEVFMGEPIDDGSTAQGVPYKYCWTPTATQTMHQIASTTTPIPATQVLANGYINDYADNPFNGNTFENAVGADINGDWTMHILDTWGGDDGYIFGWDFELCISPDVVYVDSSWSSNPITGVFTSFSDEDSLDREVVAVPNPANNDIMNISYEIEDNFGCTWRDDVDIQIWPNPIAEPDDTVLCEKNYTIGVDIPDDMPAGSWHYTVPPGAIGQVQFLPNNTVKNPQIIVPELGTYDFIYTSHCGSQASQTITFVTKAPELDIPVDTVFCDFKVDLSEIGNITDGYWTAEGPNGSSINFADSLAYNTEVIVDQFGTYSFTFTYNWCTASFTKDVVFTDVKPIVKTNPTEVLCDKTIELEAEVEGMEGQWSGFGPGFITFADFKALKTNTTVSEYGTYTFFYSGCNGSDSVQITFKQVQPTMEVPEYVQCGKEAILEANWHGMDDGVPAIWTVLEKPAGADAQLDDNGNPGTKILTVDQYGKYRVQISTCGLVDERTFAFFCGLDDIPNVFSPNNDGKNDIFYIPGLNKEIYSSSTIYIYNRWGNLVYQNKEFGLNGSWWKGKDSTGKELPSDTYFYELVLFNSANQLDEIHKGNVSLFR
jgi:gliding motility-associated-like protein